MGRSDCAQFRVRATSTRGYWHSRPVRVDETSRPIAGDLIGLRLVGLPPVSAHRTDSGRPSSAQLWASYGPPVAGVLDLSEERWGWLQRASRNPRRQTPAQGSLKGGRLTFSGVRSAIPKGRGSTSGGRDYGTHGVDQGYGGGGSPCITGLRHVRNRLCGTCCVEGCRRSGQLHSSSGLIKLNPPLSSAHGRSRGGTSDAEGDSGLSEPVHGSG